MVCDMGEMLWCAMWGGFGMCCVTSTIGCGLLCGGVVRV